MIVVFSGMDCAGKSTQIDKLTRSFQKNGKRVFYIWSRGGYTSGIEWLKQMARLILGKRVPDTGRSKVRTQKLSKPWIARLWLTVAMLDLVILYGIVIRFRSLIGQVVICDRYLGDTALDFSLNFPHINFRQMWAWHLLLWVVPKPNYSFLLLLPASISMERSKLKKEPFPDDKDTLELRLQTYQSSHWFDGYEVIDASKSIDDVGNSIREIMIKAIN